MNLTQYITTLKTIELIGKMSGGLDLAGFILEAQESKSRIVEHGLTPEDLDLLIELAKRLKDVNAAVGRIAEKSRGNRALIRNAEKN